MTTETLARPSVGQLAWRQFRYQNKVFWRTPIAAFFTVIFPLMLLVLFTAIFGNEVIEGYGITTSQFFAPGLGVFAAVSASYTNLAIGTAMARDNLILKRVRGTPIPPWAYMTGRVLSAIYLAFIAITLMMAVGVAFYGVQIYARTLPAAILTFFIGVGTFSALGMLIAAISPSGEAAPAITNATLLPIAFVSDIFIPIEDPPAWMEFVGDLFPLKAFAVAFRDAFDPNLTGMQFHWSELGYLLLWGVAATLLAIRLFKWEPTTTSGTRRQPRSP